MKDLKVGDRLKHHSGSIYHVHEAYRSGNCMVGISCDDRVLVSKAELNAQTVERRPVGKVPYAVMGFCAAPHWLKMQ